MDSYYPILYVNLCIQNIIIPKLNQLITAKWGQFGVYAAHIKSALLPIDPKSSW